MKLRNVSYWCFHSKMFLFDIIAIFSIFCGFLLFAFSATAGGCLENNSMNDIHALQLLNRVILKRCFGVEMNEYRNEIWYVFSADLKLDFFTSYFFKLHLRNYHIRISRYIIISQLHISQCSRNLYHWWWRNYWDCNLSRLMTWIKKVKTFLITLVLMYMNVRYTAITT